MSELTPPPWHWEFHPDNKKPIALASRDSDVLLATGNDSMSWSEISDEHQALLAAAPDLLAACKRALSLQWGPCHAQAPSDDCPWCKMRAAVAKAEPHA